MQGEIIQGLDVIDLVKLIQRKNRKFQAILLTDVEEILDKNSPEFIRVRKVILDHFNNYTHSIARLIFGDDFEL